MPNVDSLMRTLDAVKGISSNNSDGTNVDVANVNSHTPNQDLSAYNIKQLQYPIDLAQRSEFGDNRVLFFINVQGASKISTTGSSKTIDMPPAHFARQSGDPTSEALKKAAGSLQVDNVGITKPKRRLVSAISLYMPNALSKGYGVNWGEESGDTLGGPEVLAQLALGATQAFKGQGLDGIIDGVKAGVANAGKKMIGGMPYAQKALGVSPGNSKAEQLFQGVDFGTMNFEYSFAPRTSQEAKNVLNIIRMFRHHMLPEFIDKSSFLYVYPSEFEIRYYKGSNENEFLEKHMTAVLTNLNIDYNPNGQFTTFADGMPTHIGLSLSFRELAVPTKETSFDNKSGA